MGSKMFARGYNASRAEKERQDKVRESLGKKLWRFFITEDGDEADVRFLTEVPVNFYEHTLKVSGDRYEQYTCTGDDCEICNNSDYDSRPTYKGAYLVVDRREYEYEDKDGKKHKGNNQIRLFVQGMKVVSQLDRISNKYGLSDRDVTIVRLGRGTQTTYTIEKGDKSPVTEKEIRDWLPEKLRGDYDGSKDSLMDIIEEQLLMNAKGYTPDIDEEEYDEKDEEIYNEDDEDEGLPFGDEDEEEEVVSPFKKKAKAKAIIKKKRR